MSVSFFSFSFVSSSPKRRRDVTTTTGYGALCSLKQQKVETFRHFKSSPNARRFFPEKIDLNAHKRKRKRSQKHEL